ncbi:hypothetical protein L0657_22120 [Dyadobacter sp. CY345]|uniref:hypothetical protein n=1 Tax=Dyadobacter sp. CY345 TaxID=2909335 RepID=UPI001F268430|nr:hypothetical protein [Dyadobacter sp. CY345]MCF2446670.1 hypothetical protein [Dyadobacter sp. CY345]
MKTLVFSSKVVPNSVPTGFLGIFKMLHLETGELYVYRVLIPKHIYAGSQVAGKGSVQEDSNWCQSMFYALAEFLSVYNTTYGHLPSDKNIYQDRRSYTSDQQPFGTKVYYLVEKSKRRSLDDKELILEDAMDIMTRN